MIRRDFLKHTIALTSTASSGLLTSAAHSMSLSNARECHHFLVLFDAESVDSVDFAREFTAHGAHAFPVQQGIGQLWFGELGTAFTRGRAIAGLTSQHELTACAEFARIYGARIRYQGAHEYHEGALLSHRLRIPATLASASRTLTHSGAEWPRALASLLSNVPVGGGFACKDAYCRSAGRESAADQRALVSWIIS